jgi:aryl sulfotransferase
MLCLLIENNLAVYSSHLPLDALVFSPKVKYLYIGRDGRDMAWSLYNHHAGFTPKAYELINNVMGRVGPELEPPKVDVVEYFREWLDGKEGLPIGVSFWEHVQGWWNARHLPNVLLLHFNNLKADLPGQMRHIAQFLNIEIDEKVFARAREVAEVVRANSAQLQQCWPSRLALRSIPRR